MSILKLTVSLLLTALFAVGPGLAAVGSWNGIGFTAWNGVAITSWNGTSISTGGSGTPALIASVEENGTANTVTTGAIDTTGANLIVVNVAWYYDGSVDPDVTDSKGNTYTKLTRSTIVNATSTLFYCYGGTVGSGHTFTFAGTNTYPSIQVLAISNIAAAPFDQQNGNTASSPSTITTGSITPSQANTVAVIGVCFEDGAISPTVNTSGFSTPVTSPYVAANSYGGGIAFKVLTTTDALNPEWAFSSAQLRAAARIANFDY